jgi:hypothetical protein
MSYNLAYSIDGLTWNTGIINPVLESYSKITSGFDHLIAVSERTYNSANLGAYINNASNTYSISSDGINWTGKYINDFFSSNNFDVDINNIVFGQNKFFCIPSNGILQSSNYILSGNLHPISWKNISNNFTQFNIPTMLAAGTGVSGIFYWVGSNTRNALINNVSTVSSTNYKFDIIKISTDGVIWSYPLQGLSSSNLVKPNEYVYGNNKFLAVFESAPTSDDGSFVDSHRVAYTTNPNIWQESNPLPIPQNFKINGAVIANDNIFIIAGILNQNNVPINSGLYSTDAINWSLVQFPTGENWKVGTYGNNRFVLLSSNSNNVITSTDGVNWSLSTPFTGLRNWSDIIYYNNRFIAISKDVIAIESSSTSSSNLYISNTVIFPEQNECSYRLVYGHGKWIKLKNTYKNGDFGKYQESIDALNWSSKNFNNTNANAADKYHLVDIAAGPNFQNPNLIGSTNWWLVPTNTYKNEDLSKTGILLTGYGPMLVTNDNGLSWGATNILSSGTNIPIEGYAWNHIKYGNNTWIMAGTRKGPPNDIDGFINFIYKTFYKRLPTSLEVQDHKNFIGNISTFNISIKARLIMHIIGFSYITNQQLFNAAQPTNYLGHICCFQNKTSKRTDYITHSSHIVRTFERFRDFGIGSLNKTKYYEILDAARQDNTYVQFPGDPRGGFNPGDLNGVTSTINWFPFNDMNGLTRGTIKAIDDLAIGLIPSIGSEPQKRLQTPLGTLPDCTIGNCHTVGTALLFVNYYMNDLRWGGIYPGSEVFQKYQFILDNFPNDTYGAWFCLYCQYYATIYYFQDPPVYQAFPAVSTLVNFENRLATAFVRLMLLDQWPALINNVNPISEAEVVSILNQSNDEGIYNTIFYSTDNATSWLISDYADEAKPVQHIQYAFNKFFISTKRTNNTIDGYVSTNGINWVSGGFPRLIFEDTFPNNYETNIYNKQLISSDFNNQNGTIIVTSQSNKVFLSENSGDNFIDISNRLTPIQSPRTRFKSVANLASGIWIISEEKFDSQDYYNPTKLYISNNNGETWFSENFPISTEINLPLASNNNTIGFAGGCNVGFKIQSSSLNECGLVIWGKSPLENTFAQNTLCMDLKNPCYVNQISTLTGCGTTGINPGTIYVLFEKYIGNTGSGLSFDEPHVRVNYGNFYYRVPKTYYKFIEEVSGYGKNTHEIYGVGSGYINDPTGFQPAVTYITGTITGIANDIGQIIIDNIEINELSPIVTPVLSEDGFSLGFNFEEIPCTGDCIQNKINTNEMYLDYATGFLQATGLLNINFNKLSIGDTIYIGDEVFTFSEDQSTQNNFLNLTGLISAINNSGDVYVEYTGNNTLFFKSKISGESGNYTEIYRRSVDPSAIVITNRFMAGGKDLRIFSDTWDGVFEMLNSDLYIYYNTGNYSQFYQVITGEPVINSLVSDVIWEDSFKDTWSIVTGLNEDGGTNRFTGVINFNNNLNIFYGTGVIPSGRGEFLEYTGLNILITKQNPYNISGYIVEYLVSGNNFIFSGFLNS